MDEIDIWRAADQMMRMYGSEAVTMCYRRADAQAAQGFLEGYFVWARVARAIDELHRISRDGEPSN